MMKARHKDKSSLSSNRLPLLLVGLSVFLTACSSFAGLRTPLYDGKPFERDPESIAAFEQNREIIGEHKQFYLPTQAFSPDLLQASLDYGDHAPVLLEEGEYVVGMDLPAGRVTIFGQSQVPDINLILNNQLYDFQLDSSDSVGTLFISDADGNFYFDHMFHPIYGGMVTQVDLIPGHRLKVNGNQPGFVAFYAEELPKNPYVFDQEEAAYILSEYEEWHGESFPFPQAIGKPEEENQISLSSGVYEVGVHLPAGRYEITAESAPTRTQLYVFRQDLDPEIYEMRRGIVSQFVGLSANSFLEDTSRYQTAQIELKDGDKLMLYYINYLLLTKIE